MAFLNKNEMMFAIEEYKKEYKGKGVVSWGDCLLSVWESKLLKDNGAIGENGIRCDYPVVAVKEKDDTKYEDLGGDMRALLETISKHNQGGKTNAKIEWVPRTYCLFKECMNDLFKEDEAKRKNLISLENNYITHENSLPAVFSF